MADVKISQLPNASALDGTEQIPAVQGGNTVKATVNQIKTKVIGSGETALVEKQYINGKNVTAGNGLTGGGTLATDITINVGSTDDSIVIGADGIKVDTQNLLTSTSVTKPLAANQGKVLDEKITQVGSDLSNITNYTVSDNLDEYVGYVSYNSGTQHVSIVASMTDCKYRKIAMDKYVGKKLTISSETSDSPYNILYILVNRDDLTVINSFQDGTTTKYNIELEIPNDAKWLYVNSKAVDGLASSNVSEAINANYIADGLSNNRLIGKKCACFGDSITYYDGNIYDWGMEQGLVAKGYESYMRAEGLVVDNYGYNGAPLDAILTRIKTTDFTLYDYVTITSGANDTRFQREKGVIVTDGSAFANTFIGNLQEAIEYILSQNPMIKILLITPIKGWIFYPDGYGNLTVANLVGRDTMVDKKYADAIKEVGEYYSLPVCDWYNMTGLNIYTRSWFMNDPEPTTVDNINTIYSLHPSSLGFKRMADILIPILKSI